MAKAVSPNEIPTLPDGAQAWGRSLRRGSMFHAHILGSPVCNARLYLDRNNSEAPKGLADMRYWGVCPNCFRLSLRATEVTS